MRITFLGHQGWQFENDGHGLLLDPIVEEVGNGAARLPVWPQRRLDMAQFEPVDAVIISHEHADHFSLSTLLALPRRCTVHIPDLASTAMAGAIASLGFRVERFRALSSFTVAGIEVTALPGLYNMLEPDTYSLLMQDASGASFFTAIDTVAHPDLFGWLAQHCPRRTLDNLTNNFIEPLRPLVNDPLAHAKSRAVVAGSMSEFVRKFSPRRAVVSGQGWSFRGAKSWLNHVFFSVDNDWLIRTAREIEPQVNWLDAAPGTRFALRGDDVTVDQSPLIGETQRPSREFNPAAVSRDEPYEPWTGMTTISPERLHKVCSFIVERYGQILGAYAPKLMERLYYLKFQPTRDLTPTLAISLRNGTDSRIFEFDYGQLLFPDVTATAIRPAAVGLEIWAADVESLIDAAEEAFMVYESAVRPWSFVPDMIEPAALIEAFLWFTPRFRPQEFLQAYLAQIAALQAR
jgi:hypothetical protein